MFFSLYNGLSLISITTLPAFIPLPGASGYQLSNPSVLDTTAHLASLELFTLANPRALQQKSRRLTSYLYYLLTHPLSHFNSLSSSNQTNPLTFRILTPHDPAHRGAQLSIHFPTPGLMPRIIDKLFLAGIVVDQRNPDVIRVAPTPMYNTFSEVWEFVQQLLAALRETVLDGVSDEKEGI